MSADGIPFSQNVSARNLRADGAMLCDLSVLLAAGDVIGLQSGIRKARFRIVNSERLSSRVAEICLVDGQACPWADILPPQPSPARLDREPGLREKRRFTRYHIPFPIELSCEETNGIPMRTVASDVSGRGCYVETFFPLPVGTQLNFVVHFGERKVESTAIVRACDGGVGMGIEFVGLNLDTQTEMQNCIENQARAAKEVPGR